jgi:hypothetical protein
MLINKGEIMNRYYLRKCNGCNKGISQGIYLFNEYYFCNEDCLNNNYKRLNITFTLDTNPITEEVSYSEFLEWINTDNNYELYQVYDYYNGISEWYRGDDWGYVFTETGEEIDIEDVKTTEIIQGNIKGGE